MNSHTEQKQIVGLLIRSNGTRERGNFDSLAALQAAVGGLIEVVECRLPGHGAFDMYLNEEGKMMSLPLNGVATQIAQIPGDVIVGDVVLLGRCDDEGASTSLPASVLSGLDPQDELAELVKVQQYGAVVISKGFARPDADWEPVVFAQDAAGDTTLIEVDGRMLRDEAGKAALAVTLLRQLVELDAVRCSMIVSAWSAAVDSRVPEHELLPAREMRNREEILLITAFDRNGSEIAVRAPIERSDTEPPTLGAWMRLPAAGKAGGRFTDALRAGVAGALD